MEVQDKHRNRTPGVPFSFIVDKAMIVGNRVSFGIEWELSDEPMEAWMFGQFCYWINGQQFGRYDEDTSLRDVLMELEYVAQCSGRRDHDGLWALTPLDMFLTIDKALYVGGDPELDARAIAETWCRFLAYPGVNVMSGIKAFAVSSAGQTRLVVSRDPYTDIVLHFQIASEDFEGAISQVIDSLINSYEELSGQKWR